MRNKDDIKGKNMDDMAADNIVTFEDAVMEECCTGKTKEWDDGEYRELVNRLSRIEGQVRGVKRMVENDAYCIDILIQVSAISAALNSFNRVLLSDHIKTCVKKDIIEGKDETIDELLMALQRLMK